MKNRLFAICLLLLVHSVTTAQVSKDFDAGVAKFRAKEYDAVIETFTSIISNPSHDKRFDEDLYFYRGQSYFHKGEYDKSLSDLNQSLTLNHFNKGTIYWYQARCYDKQGKKTEATASYKEALTAAQSSKKLSAQILADRAQFNKQQGDLAAANEDLALAKSLDPTNKEIAQASISSQPSTTANRTAGEDKKTQVIVKSNPNQGTTTQPAQTQKTQQQNTPPPSTPAQQVNTELVAALAGQYKDEKRYALVIGNSNYSKEIGILKNPLNDATDVATELRKSQFEVQLITNATYVQMREAMRKFQEKLTEGPRRSDGRFVLLCRSWSRLPG